MVARDVKRNFLEDFNTTAMAAIIPPPPPQGLDGAGALVVLVDLHHLLGRPSRGGWVNEIRKAAGKT